MKTYNLEQSATKRVLVALMLLGMHIVLGRGICCGPWEDAMIFQDSFKTTVENLATTVENFHPKLVNRSRISLQHKNNNKIDETINYFTVFIPFSYSSLQPSD